MGAHVLVNGLLLVALVCWYERIGVHVPDSRRKLRVAMPESAAVNVREIPSRYGVTHIAARSWAPVFLLSVSTWLRLPWRRMHRSASE
jgi:hypothetical protein